ncbi:MAG: ribose 5-phosphate isomerase B [Armatimonadetes bacterium]|nr:ribose 5-phosphate isomerase B [Armatimonadota bacterium]
MEIALGSEHAGYQLKERVKGFLGSLGYSVKDYGAYDELPNDDYPFLARAVAEAVAREDQHRGILICGTGQGMCISANKVPGVRATLCNDLFSAKASREHNDGNVLVLGARIVGDALAEEIVRVWLATEFAGGRHAARLERILTIERDMLSGRYGV